MTGVQIAGVVVLCVVAAGLPAWCLCVAAARRRPTPPAVSEPAPLTREQLHELPLTDAITAQQGWQLVDEIEEWLTRGEHR